MKIASERTGYEPDMLDLDAGIEADLGIDSIKRVEILTRLAAALDARRAGPDARRDGKAHQRPHPARNRRPHRRRIRRPAAPQREPEPAGPAPQVPRFILAATAQPRRQSKPQYFPGRVCLITDDETGIAAAVADELNRAGERALLLRHSPDATISDGAMCSPPT